MVVLVRTRSRSTYLFAESDEGVRWCRVPGRDAKQSWVASGLEASMPRIVRGERLILDGLRTTHVTEVSVLADEGRCLGAFCAAVSA